MRSELWLESSRMYAAVDTVAIATRFFCLSRISISTSGKGPCRLISDHRNSRARASLLHRRRASLLLLLFRRGRTAELQSHLPRLQLPLQALPFLLGEDALALDDLLGGELGRRHGAGFRLEQQVLVREVGCGRGVFDCGGGGGGGVEVWSGWPGRESSGSAVARRVRCEAVLARSNVEGVGGCIGWSWWWV